MAERAAPSPLPVVVCDGQASVDVSNINLALDNPSQNDYVVGKVHPGRDEDSMEGAEVGGEPAATPVPAHGTQGSLARTALQVPGGARGSASVAISNINLAVDTPSQSENVVKPRGLRHEEDEDGAADTATMEGCEVGGEPAPSPRLGPLRDVEVSNINLALDTPSQGDYMATQLRQEQVDTEAMVGSELGGRAVTPDPSAVVQEAPATTEPAAAATNVEASGEAAPGSTPATATAPAAKPLVAKKSCCVIC